MQGVEILNSYEIVLERSFGWEPFGQTFILLFGLTVLITACASIGDRDWIYGLKFGAIIGLVVATFGGVLMGMACGTPTKCQTQYEVTVSSEVSMSEFNQRYIILDQRGEILIVTEKDGN